MEQIHQSEMYKEPVFISVAQDYQEQSSDVRGGSNWEGDDSQRSDWLH